MEKPNVDIEWYDDGFSMEEQEELRNQVLQQKKKFLKVTPEYHQKTQEKIINELKQKLAADEEYIYELESKADQKYQEKLDTITNSYNTLKNQYTILNKKYQLLLEDPDLGFSKYIDKIKKLEQENKNLISVRDQLLVKLCTQK